MQLLAAPTSVSHRHPQGKGGTIPEASILKGSVPAQGAPGEQGPAGICILHVSIKWSQGFCVLLIESEIIRCSFSQGAATLLSPPPFTLTSAHILFPPLDGCSFP